MVNHIIKAGVIGHPINHSKSPIIHGHWIDKYGLQGTYRPIDISPENLQVEISKLIREGYAGFNVTIPYKQSIFELCDYVDDVAKSIGAVNTVVVKNGMFHGTNTDAFGYIQNLKFHNIHLQKHKPAIVLGAGGAARAIVYGLLEEGFDNILITNRTIEKSYDVLKIDEAKISVLPWENRSEILQGAGLVVNTTALGMTGKDPLDIDFSGLPIDCIVSDIVYAPLMTPFLSDGQKRGNPVVTGIGMLLHQARPAFEKWFGILPDVDDELVRKVLA